MLAAIVARAQNGAIGLNNQLLWHIPEDLRFFKEKTQGHVIIMGRRTFESLPGVLPNREHWVITSQVGYADEHPGIRCFSTVKEAYEASRALDAAYVIGGATIYEAFLPYLDRIYVTEVAHRYEGDVFFPLSWLDDFKEVVRSEPQLSATYPWPFQFVTYERMTE